MRERMEAQIRELKDAWAEEKRAREDEVTELERRNVAAKDRLKKEMFRKIKQTKVVRVQCAIAPRLP